MLQKSIILIFINLMSNHCFSQEFKNTNLADSSRSFYEAEASCGSCQFNMKGNGCFLAIRINTKNYFVQGAGIDDFGDAHHKDGFCNSIRKVTIQGEIKADNFILTYLHYK